MSVHAGIWNLSGEPVDRECLTRLTRSLEEYGPDGETTFMCESVGMLYRPFHTTPESRFEHQPYVSARGNVITWDGRLDNLQELILELGADMSVDSSDISIVASAFDRWGTDCFAKLIGDWGVAIWDCRDKELVLSRDYMGIRHLFYYLDRNRIVWCNHLAPLALRGAKLSLCDEYIAGYLIADPDADLTPYREIHSVSPGQFVRLRNGMATTQVYWTFDSRLATRCKTDAEYEEQYRYHFRRAVRRRLRTDSPILADLSGGLDSSSIVCMADDILSKEGAPTPSVDTFSLYHSTDPDFDDQQYFTKVEQKRGKIGFHADLRTCGDPISLEESTFVACPGFGMRAEIKSALSTVPEVHRYRVALSGMGGDDMNGQGLDVRVQMAELLLDFRLMELAKQLTSWSLFYRKRPWIQLLFQSVFQLMPLSVRSKLGEQGKVESWIDVRFAKRQKLSLRQTAIAKGTSFLRPKTRDALQNITARSRLMSYSEPSIIERRYPYLDKNLVEFLKSIPLDQLLRPGNRRSLMRRALADLLPREVLSRKTKATVTRGYCVAIQKHWDQVEYAFSSPLSADLGYVDRDRIRTALLALKNGQAPRFLGPLLRALCLEVWLRNAAARGVISIPCS